MLYEVITFFKLIGKWSMADVFVVSTFLVYFSASKGSMSQAEVQVGFYFFFIYVIVSMLTSVITSYSIHYTKLYEYMRRSAHILYMMQYSSQCYIALMIILR